MRKGVAIQAPLCIDPGAQVNTHSLSPKCNACVFFQEAAKEEMAEELVQGS